MLKRLEVLFSLRFSICISPSWVFVFHPFRNLYFWWESKVGTGGRWWSGGSWQAWEWEGLLSLPLMLKPLDCDGDYSGDDDNWGGDDDTFTGRRRGGLVSPVGTHSGSVQFPPYQQFSSILKNSLFCILSKRCFPIHDVVLQWLTIAFDVNTSLLFIPFSLLGFLSHSLSCLSWKGGRTVLTEKMLSRYLIGILWMDTHHRVFSYIF